MRRPSREGYKAGALAYGLLETDGEFIAIFDADFVPAPTFCGVRCPISPAPKWAWCKPAGPT
ncbi:glycosyltransferase [Hymenobacter cellulosilyticus]|uniref:glycosyltransferase n=1 Tax=Hymenobacter cellulosilyticus TaxID=2932248 RepID=UPI00288030D1|nr:glycosyltransferase [Hymenobacter cellulosilyticus]